MLYLFCFFKQKTAYEMRISDWSSDVCSSDLNMRGALKALPDIGRALGRIAIGRGSPRDLGQLRDGLNEARLLRERMGRLPDMPALMAELLPLLDGHEIGRASCRERVCQSV